MLAAGEGHCRVVIAEALPGAQVDARGAVLLRRVLVGADLVHVLVHVRLKAPELGTHLTPLTPPGRPPHICVVYWTQKCQLTCQT